MQAMQPDKIWKITTKKKDCPRRKLNEYNLTMDADGANHVRQLVGGVILAMSELEFLIFKIINAQNTELTLNNYIAFGKLVDGLKETLMSCEIKGDIIQPLIRDLTNLNIDRHKFAHEILLENPAQHPGKVFLSKNRKNSGWFKILDGDEIEKEYSDFMKRCGVLWVTLVQIAREDLKLSI